MWPGFRQPAPSPAGWALLTLETQDAGKCVAEALDSICLLSAGSCLPITWPGVFQAAWLLVTCSYRGMVCREMGRGFRQHGGGAGRRIAPTRFQSKLSVPGQRGIMGQVAATLAVRLMSFPQHPAAAAATGERRHHEGYECLRTGAALWS